MKNITKKLPFIVTILTLLVFVGGESFAAEKKIAVVDIQKIMQKSTAAKSARSQLKAKQKQFQNELNKQEKMLQKKDQELGKKRSSMSKEAFEKQVQDFRKQAIKTQKEVQSKRLQLNKAFNSALGQIQKNVTNIIANVSKKKDLDMVIPMSQVLYYKPSLDISEEVLTEVNKKFPSMKVKF